MDQTLAARIRQAREDQGWTQKQLGEALGYSNVAVQHWERGRSQPNFETLQSIAKALGKPLSYFLGEMGSDSESVRRQVAHEVRNVLGSVGVKILPVIGRIAAGTPLLAEQNIEEYIPVPEEFAATADFLLKVRGDSMVNAGIQDGDYVLVRQTDQADPGDIVVALVNGDHATLKFLRYHNNRYYLEAANPDYTPIPVDDEVHVQGVYVGLFTRRGLAASPRSTTTHEPPGRDALIAALAAEENLSPEQLRLAIQLLKAGQGKS